MNCYEVYGGSDFHVIRDRCEDFVSAQIHIYRCV